MIENPQVYLRSLWNWKPLRSCFPRGIEPTDIDGWVEVGGYFLVLEGKAPNVPLKAGQRILFERMQRWNEIVPGLFTMIVIWGDAETGRIDELQFWPAAPFSAGWEQLISYCSAWAEVAEERAAIQEEARRTAMAKATPPPIAAKASVR
jgi:hypothetical protein